MQDSGLKGGGFDCRVSDGRSTGASLPERGLNAKFGHRSQFRTFAWMFEPCSIFASVLCTFLRIFMAKNKERYFMALNKPLPRSLVITGFFELLVPIKNTSSCSLGGDVG